MATHRPQRKFHQVVTEPGISGIDNWFYVPTWERTPFTGEIGRKSSEEKISWLIFSDRWGGGTGFQRKLEELGAVVQVVRFGEKYLRRKDGSFEINTAGPDDYLKLFREIKGKFGDNAQYHSPGLPHGGQ